MNEPRRLLIQIPDPNGPVLVVHDHLNGTTAIQPDLDVRVAFKSPRGITVRQAAQSLFSTDDPSRNEIEKARRKLDLRGLNLILTSQ